MRLLHECGKKSGVSAWSHLREKRGPGHGHPDGSSRGAGGYLNKLERAATAGESMQRGKSTTKIGASILKLEFLSMSACICLQCR